MAQSSHRRRKAETTLSASVSLLQSVTITPNPFFVSAKAVFLPSPRLAPVTKAILSPLPHPFSFVFQHGFIISLKSFSLNTQTSQMIA
jgi:hypothetical protein